MNQAKDKTDPDSHKWEQISIPTPGDLYSLSNCKWYIIHGIYLVVFRFESENYSYHWKNVIGAIKYINFMDEEPKWIECDKRLPVELRQYPIDNICALRTNDDMIHFVTGSVKKRCVWKLKLCDVIPELEGICHNKDKFVLVVSGLCGNKGSDIYMDIVEMIWGYYYKYAYVYNRNRINLK